MTNERFDGHAQIQLNSSKAEDFLVRKHVARNEIHYLRWRSVATDGTEFCG